MRLKYKERDPRIWALEVLSLIESLMIQVRTIEDVLLKKEILNKDEYNRMVKKVNDATTKIEKKIAEIKQEATMEESFLETLRKQLKRDCKSEVIGKEVSQ